MNDTHAPVRGSTPAAALFGRPALTRRQPPAPPAASDRPPARPAVSASVVRAFRPARLGTCYDVDLTLWGAVKLRVVVSGSRLTTAFLRGEAAFEIADPALAAEAHRAAVEAAQDALRRGWTA